MLVMSLSQFGTNTRRPAGKFQKSIPRAGARATKNHLRGHPTARIQTRCSLYRLSLCYDHVKRLGPLPRCLDLSLGLPSDQANDQLLRSDHLPPHSPLSRWHNLANAHVRPLPSQLHIAPFSPLQPIAPISKAILYIVRGAFPCSSLPAIFFPPRQQHNPRSALAQRPSNSPH